MIKRWLKYFYVLLLLVISIGGFAQQDPLFSQYMNNPGIINPAYAGYNGNININGILRKQWLGIDWSPTTTTLSVNSPYKTFDVGLGLSFVNDQIGPQKQNGIYADYARHFSFALNRNIALGLKAGFNHIDIDLISLRSRAYDPHIAQNPYYKVFLPNFGVGMFYYTDNFYLGISVPKLIRNSIREAEDTRTIIGREERHYFVTTGYLFEGFNPFIKIRPGLMARIVNGAPASMDISITSIFLERVWFGFTYRLGDAVSVLTKFQINEQFQFGYSYDLNNSRLKGFNSGTHEIFINYNFSFMGNRIRSPRYF